MKTRKGPYGHFAVTTMKEKQKIYKYALKIIEDGQIDGLLPAFSDEKKNGIEISFDYTGLKSIDEYQNITKEQELINRRSAIRDFFRLFITLLNKLLPLDNIILDNRFIYYSGEKNKIYLCYLPYETTTNLELKSITTDRLEKLLNHHFFQDCLSSDEITTISYAIKNNDEKLLDTIFNNEIANDNKAKVDIDKLSFRLLLIFSLICAIIMFTINSTEYGIFLLFISFCLSIKVFADIKHSKTNQESNELKSKRTEILFEEDPDLYIDASDLFSYANLEPLVPTNGIKQKIGLYSNETSIGSDRFISDIYIDDPSISAIQAKIFHENNAYWIVDYSNRNNTFLENRALIPNKKYEIKNGQHIRLGQIDYIFKIGY